MYTFSVPGSLYFRLLQEQMSHTTAKFFCLLSVCCLKIIITCQFSQLSARCMLDTALARSRQKEVVYAFQNFFFIFTYIFSYHQCALFFCSLKAIFEIVHRNSCQLLIYSWQFSQPSALYMLNSDLARSSQKEFVYVFEVSPFIFPLITSYQQCALLFCSWKSMFQVVHRNSCSIFIYSICYKIQSIIFQLVF